MLNTDSALRGFDKVRPEILIRPNRLNSGRSECVMQAGDGRNEKKVTRN